MPKRARETQDDTSSQVAAPEAPKQKKTRLSAVPPASASKPHKLDSKAAASKKGKRTKKAVLEPSKRPILPGRLNRLAVPKPQSLAARKGGSGSTRPDVNRRGNKINKGWGTGGFDTAPAAGTSTEDIGELASDKDKKASSSKSNKAAPVGAEMWITRKSAYSAYLKSGVAAFMHKGNHTLILRALGAAIPVCLSLTLAIRDALPCGEEGTTMDMRTGSVDVNDEIVPEDGSENEDEDIQYQVRTKSSVECIISLKKGIRQRLLVSSTGVSANHTLGAKTMGVRPGRGGRGKPVRGGMGRHQGRGRGRAP